MYRWIKTNLQSIKAINLDYGANRSLDDNLLHIERTTIGFKCNRHESKVCTYIQKLIASNSISNKEKNSDFLSKINKIIKYTILNQYFSLQRFNVSYLRIFSILPSAYASRSAHSAPIIIDPAALLILCNDSRCRKSKNQFGSAFSSNHNWCRRIGTWFTWENAGINDEKVVSPVDLCIEVDYRSTARATIISTDFCGSNPVICSPRGSCYGGLEY